MSFSAEWLALREPVDHRSRNRELAEAVRSHFAGRTAVSVVDLGCGTGSNLRATHLLLPYQQNWTLIDYDPALLDAARDRLAGWADSAEPAGNGMVLAKGAYRIAVHFRQVDLNANLAAALAPTPDLVTASALFDLISEGWITGFAEKLAALPTAFYTVLTYDGRDAFTPPHPTDHAVIAAFAAHQGGDKGFGPAAGPRGADALRDAFAGAGFTVREGDSPWRLGQPDRALAHDLLGGIANAVRESGRLAETEIAAWLDFRRAQLGERGSLVLTGHRDTFAVPR